MRNPVVRAFFAAPSGYAAAAGLGLIAALAVAAPMLLGDTAAQGSIMRSGEPPSWDYPLGTDALGRPILSRVLVATRLSMALALSATAIAATIGIAVGLGVALLGPRLRPLGLRAIDVVLSFPGILLAIVITSIVGIGTQGAVIAIGIAYAPDFARLASTLAISATGRDYVAAAVTLGVPPWRRLTHYILPNIGDAMLVSVFATSAGTLIAVSSLSFLGLGVQPPQYDWGRMLVEGIESFYATPVAALAPATMIAIGGLALGYFGEALARATNPLLWTPASAGPVVDRATARPAPADADSDEAILQIRNLRVCYPGPDGRPMPVVDGVSLTIAPGEVIGVVGESGSGKSQTALAAAKLLEPPAEVTADRHLFCGQVLELLSAEETRALLGSRLALVFQDPMTSLNPTMRVGEQVAEPGFLHGGLSRDEALDAAAARLRDVGIPAPETRLASYPHEFSGGMQQRAMIAMGLMTAPALLIADEPTTALDVTIQAQVVEVLRAINRDRGTAILLISHNLGVVASLAHRIAVMYAGRIVETGPTNHVVARPAHPYTRLLLEAMPRLDGPVDKPLAAIEGQPPSPANRPPGCAFASRCPQAAELCRREDPVLVPRPGSRAAACHFAGAP